MQTWSFTQIYIYIYFFFFFFLNETKYKPKSSIHTIFKSFKMWHEIRPLSWITYYVTLTILLCLINFEYILMIYVFLGVKKIILVFFFYYYYFFLFIFFFFCKQKVTIGVINNQTAISRHTLHNKIEFSITLVSLHGLLRNKLSNAL